MTSINVNYLSQIHSIILNFSCDFFDYFTEIILKNSQFTRSLRYELGPENVKTKVKNY